MVHRVHDANLFRRRRELANKEDRLANFDCPNDCGFEFLARRVDVCRVSDSHVD